MSRAESTPRSEGLRLVIAGTGGQGVITAARLLGEFFAEQGCEVVSGQAHGMSQRGGSVQATVVVDRGPSPVIPRGSADVLLGLEPLEAARALPFAGPQTRVLVNRTTVPLVVTTQRLARGEPDARPPDLEQLCDRVREVTPHLTLLDASAEAVAAGDCRALNTVLLGALFGRDDFPWPAESLARSLGERAPQRIAEVNRKAFQRGVALARSGARSASAGGAADLGHAPAGDRGSSR